MKYRALWFGTLFLVLVAGALPAQAARQEIGKDLYKNLDLLSKALHYVREHYIEDPDDQKLLHGAIRGMLSTLDPHTVFMPPADYKELQLDTKGRFGGIGIEVTVRDDVLTVITPIEGTPASRAGIRAGDQILRIGAISTRGMLLGEAVKLMRGRQGSKVRLLIRRKKTGKNFTVSLRRDIIRILSVRGLEDLGEGLAYVRVSSFQQNTAKELDRSLRKLEGKNREQLRGLVIDLRNNPGGLLQEAIAMADQFLEKGVIVSTKGRNQPAHEQEARSEGTHPSFPMIILVNEGSASAAEIVAGALQDHGRAVILGMPTFGKGSVQTIFELGRGAALKLTVARYYTPSGRSIQAEGIQPDILIGSDPKEATVRRPGAIREKDLKRHLKSEGAESDSNEITIEFEGDPQKQAAVDYLRSWAIFGKRISL